VRSPIGGDISPASGTPGNQVDSPVLTREIVELVGEVNVGAGRKSCMASRRGPKTPRGEVAEHVTVKAVESIRSSAGTMLQVLQALHGALLLPFFLSPYFTTKDMKSMKGRRLR
jgi:hypothetical protein